MTLLDTAPESQEGPLSSLERDGRRRRLYPRVSPGRFLLARRLFAYVLIAVFTLLPYVEINGKPSILLDIVQRQFTFFGKTFLPTDTTLLALLLVSVVVAVFLLTALLGRVWCGYACPQTVYMEFVYRPLERLFDGPPRRRGKPGTKRSISRTAAKYVVFLLISMFLAHTFLAYFVGVEALQRWVLQSPLEHPTSFMVMLVTTALMVFDFCYFREQTCIIACPYGRLQSVLFDRDTLVISYDPKRGEPRGKPKRRREAPSATSHRDQQRGDCVDCDLCVDTCPTGIDIRDGVKMECIGCAQCIDACDRVMDRLGRPRGLIRYSSQARIAGEGSRIIRPRVIIYPLILVVLAVVFSVALSGQKSADVTLLRGLGMPFVKLATGEISNQVRLKITNRGVRPAAYSVEIVGGTPGRLIVDETPFTVEAGKSRTQALLIVEPESVFVGGTYSITLRVADGGDFSEELTCRLFGPVAPSPGAGGGDGTTGE